MSDTGSALAINDKKTQRTGGCVGIFSQLFDWKKKLARKKFFPNKLLSLDSAQHGSKKFRVDDKLPKLRLMSNGTKNVDPGQKHAMRTPTLVARLMGLDSLPAVQRDKIKKFSSAKIEVDSGGKSASDHCQFYGQHIELEKEGSKLELKPHKLQKTEFSERRAVARFGAEGLHFRKVLSRSSKQHLPNFAPPVKSPKRLSKRNAARLIGAATRILEPGLQARNRAKCVLPYSTQKNYNPTDGLLVEAGTALSKDQVESSTFDEYSSFSRGQSSCGNCGNVVDIPESGTYLEKQPSVLEYVACPLSGLEKCTQRSTMSSLGTEKERVYRRSPKKFTAFAVQSLGNVNPRAVHNLERAALHKGSQTRWQFPSQQYEKEEILPSSICYKQNVCFGAQGITRRDKNLPRSTYTVHLSKEVPLNQNTIDHKRSRVPAKLDKCGYVSKRRSTDRLYDPLSSARKRRSIDVAKDDVCSFVGSTINKQRNIKCSALGEKMVRRDVQSAKLTCTSSNLARLGKINKTSDTRDDVASFTPSSSKKHKDRTLAKANDRGYQSECTCSSSSQKGAVLDKINRNGPVCFQKSSPSTVDTLGVLEQKLKDMRNQGDNEMTLRGYPLKLTPAIILQDLISALTAERSSHVNDVISGPIETGVLSFCEHTSNAHPSFQAQQKKEAAQLRHLYDRNNNNMSPLSVLEASISNRSFLSSSLDDGLVHKLQTDFIDLSQNEQQLKPGVDLVHGTISISKGKPGIALMVDFVNSISDVLCSMDLVDSRLKGSKLAHAKEVILNAELVLGNPFRHNSNESKDFSICQFIVNELETLGSVLWTNFGCFSESEDTEGNLLKGFLFDCVIEYLDSRYVSGIKGRMKSWTELPESMNAEMLIQEVVEEIRRWTSWTGFALDELIEREMSNWTDFDVEAFETSVAIHGEILHSLVDEIVIDLWLSKLD